MDDLILVITDDDEGFSLCIEEDDESITLDLGNDIAYPTYTGETEFTPTQQAQIVFTSGKVVLDNITINPIPSNYGLVTYHANIITIT